MHPADGITFPELVQTLTHPDGVWAHHSDADSPAWVASTDPDLATRLGALWSCNVVDPSEVPEV